MNTESVSRKDSIPHSDRAVPAVAIASVNGRGTMTIPASIREHLQADATPRYLLRAVSGDVFVAMRVKTPHELFVAYDALVAEPRPALPLSVTFPTLLDAESVIIAQCEPTSTEREWFAACDQGDTSIRVDPLFIGDLLTLLPTYLPDLDRAAQAIYVQTILCWTGMQMPDRDFYLAVLSLWAQSPGYRWSQAVQVARASVAG